jgi:16S rRNA (adenine1518-N6/adenine1519-N6)-dimethyltransferase
MVIANLPYNVGTAMVVDWIKRIAELGQRALTSFTVMLQKEVAERMVARVGDDAYGRLSLMLQQYCDTAILFDVPPGAFSPPPKVTSAILHARVLPTPREDVSLAALEKVTAAAFGQRRKMLRQSLKSLGVNALDLCARAEVDATWRAEQCDLAAFARLARALIPT